MRCIFVGTNASTARHTAPSGNLQASGEEACTRTKPKEETTMKRMQKRIARFACALVALAMLIRPCAPVRAEYFGT